MLKKYSIKNYIFNHIMNYCVNDEVFSFLTVFSIYPNMQI